MNKSGLKPKSSGIMYFLPLLIFLKLMLGLQKIAWNSHRLSPVSGGVNQFLSLTAFMLLGFSVPCCLCVCVCVPGVFELLSLATRLAEQHRSQQMLGAVTHRICACEAYASPVFYKPVQYFASVLVNGTNKLISMGSQPNLKFNFNSAQPI